MSTMTTPARLPLGRLLVIAGAIFASMSSEFAPTGLLPGIAAELRVPESQVGFLVTLFALTVVVSTVPLAALTRPLGRKPLMIAMLLGLAAANLVAAVAPDYTVLAISRVLGGLFHGLFWAVTGPYASRLVRPDQLTRALSVTSVGGTLAFVLGVPVATAIGQALSWRIAFAILSGAILVFAVLVAWLLPPVEHRVPLTTGEIVVAARKDPTLPGVVVLLAVILLLVTGHNVLYAYISPWLTGVAGVPLASVSVLLFVYGAAGALAIVLVAAVGSRAARRMFVGLAAGVGIGVAVVALGGAGHGASGTALVIAGLVVWSLAYSAWATVLNARMLRTASHRLRDTAAAMMTTAFNVAIGGGAFLGGIVLDGAGIRTLPWVLEGLVAASIVLILVGVVWWPVRHTVGRR